jgi:hypothetical protein
MATNNSTSLYSFTSNVQVSSNNFTTLYNTTASNITTANVPGKNFTTLYTEQDTLKPTLPYGNSNVEAFLNVGYDAGGNQVQNIHMANSLYVGGNSYLGNVGNVFITGGNYNYVLSTDGTGNLNWVNPTGAGDPIPYISFAVTTTANNQQFSNAELQNYPTSNLFNVMKNGVNIEPTLYTKVNANTVQINVPLSTGDSIDVLASGGGAIGPGGNVYDVQYSTGVYLGGNSNFTYNPTTSTLSITNANITTGNITTLNTVTSNLGDIANVHISGGSAGYRLQTDGLGNLSWQAPVGGGNANVAGSNTQIQYNNGTNLGASANLTFNSSTKILTVDYIVANGSGLTSLTGANVTGTVANASYAVTSGSATTAGYAVTAGSTTFAENSNVANIANSVSGSNVSGPVPQSNYANIANSVSGSNVSGSVSQANYANIANSVSGSNVSGSVSQANYANIANSVAGANVSGNVANANYANYAGTVVNSTQSNITSLGTLTDLTVGGNVILQRAFEKVTTNATGSTGTVNFDVITQSIILKTANATANFTLNVRGNSTVTLDTLLPTNDSLTVAYVNPVGTTAYYANIIQIDGTTITPSYVNGVTPADTTRLSNAKQSYTYTIIKTAANTYTVLGSYTEYK